MSTPGGAHPDATPRASDLDQWRVDLIEADLRVAALERARDAAYAEAIQIRRIVAGMESLERRRAVKP